ncbi:MAG TPA: universal stress protein, partial [Longimicrobium sp.]|nr:universal stress protein [Longimicrobium sp.]
MRQLVLRNVLVATDFTDESAGAVQAAAALAGLAGARLHVVHAARPGERDVEARLREHVARLSPEAGEAATMAPPGAPEEVILQAAERTRADVIVLGPHRRRGGGALGSTADRVVRGAEVPCLIVPRALELPLRRVVAAIDLSD